MKSKTKTIKKVLGFALSLSICASFIPCALTASAEESDYTITIPPTLTVTDSGWNSNGIKKIEVYGYATPAPAHTHDDITFTAWDSANSLPTEAGSYYLTTDVTLNANSQGRWIVTGVTNLCLNGHVITMESNGDYTTDVVVVETGSTLNLYDKEDNSGIITHSGDAKGSGIDVKGGTFNMYGGTISGNKGDRTTGYGGGVYVYDGGSFTMYGGIIKDNTGSNGGGVYVEGSSSFTLKDGSITGNKASNFGGGLHAKGGTVIVNGGNISSNNAVGNGGGIYVGYESTLTMTSGSVTENSGSNGAGMYMNNSTVSISGGSISSNICTTWGAGIYVDKATLTFGSEVSINNNTANYLGGGMYIDGSEVRVPSGVTITGNTARNGGGVYVPAGSGFTLAGGEISANNAINTDGGGIYGKGATALVRIESGTITGNTAKEDGGGMFVSNAEMSGGEISNNTANAYGGGIAIASNGSFTHNGGTISDNKAVKYGGGIFGYQSTINVNGGEIVSNEAVRAGGIFANAASVVNLSGGNISNNKGTEYYGGVYLAKNAAINVSGSPVVTSNKQGNSESNVYLSTDKKITVTGTLQDNAAIGVTTADVPSETTPTVVFTSGLSGQGDVVGFTSDNTEYVVSASNSNEAQLVRMFTSTATGYSGSYDGEAHGITVNVTNPADGAVIKYGTEEGNYEQTESPAYTDAGTYTVYYQITADGYVTKTGSAAVIIDKAVIDSVTAPAVRTLTYNGQAQALVTAGTVLGGTMQYKLGENGTYSENIPTATNAGNYTVYYKVLGDANHKDSDEGRVNVTIAKANVSINAPTANELTYNGQAQALVTAGTVAGGTMQYKLGENGTYSETIPTAINAGDYTVYYKAVGDNNHQDSDEGSVDVTIGKATVTVTAGAKSKTFGEADPELTYTSDGLFGNDKLTGALSRKDGNDVGEYDITVGTLDVPSNNYTLQFTGAKLTVNTKDISDAVISLEANELEYNGSAQSPVITEVKLGNTVLTGNDYEIDTESDFSKTDYGTYTLTVKGNGNYTGTASKEWKITKTLPTVSALPSASAITYGQTLADSKLSDGAMNTAGIFSWADDTIAPTVANSNVTDYDVVFNPTDTSNFDPVTIKVKVTVNPADQNAPNVNKADETIKNKKDGALTGIDNTMEYKAEGDEEYTPITGNTVENLSAGTYLVRYKADDNHNASPDTTVVIGEGAAITVSFETNGGSEVDEITGLSYNDKITEPTEPTRDKFYFAGWYKDKDCTELWSFSNDTVKEKDITLYAKWSAIPAHTVKGIVYENDAVTPKHNVKVSLVKGNEIIGITTTDDKGEFNIIALEDTYNIIATDEENDITKTELVELKADTEIKVVMPNGQKESILDNTDAGDFEAIVGGLDAIAEKETVAADEKVTITLAIRDEEAASSSAEKTAFEEAKTAISESTEAKGKTLDYFDLTLTKTVTDTINDTVKSTEKYTITDKSLITVKLTTYNSAGKTNISLIRYTDSGIEEITTTPNENGEYIEVENDGSLTIHVAEIAPYAVSYTTPTKRSGGGGSSSTYAITSETAENGKVKTSVSSAVKGKEVKITATPNEGYELDTVTVTDKDGKTVEVTKNEDGTYSFTMPASKVTVTPVFKEALAEPTTSPAPTTEPQATEKPSGDKDKWFVDVPESSWYYAPIKEAFDAERMSGMSDDYFEPETDITRGMFAYAIYRREGLPEFDGVNKFDDVKANSYYETAIAWATENEIVAGYDDTHYGPDDQITREQMAAILWRYAKFKEYDVSVGEDTNILDFTDAFDISEYAIPAIQWAVGDSVITGFEDSTMRPKANANRAQMAVILNKIADMF